MWQGRGVGGGSGIINREIKISVCWDVDWRRPEGWIILCGYKTIGDGDRERSGVGSPPQADIGRQAEIVDLD